jgi:hypothetical protein
MRALAPEVRFSDRLSIELVRGCKAGVVCGRKAPKSILPTSIAGVLRLRALKPSVRDRSAKRFAQDDGFVGGLERRLVGYAEKHEKIEKVTASPLRMISFLPALPKAYLSG